MMQSRMYYLCLLMFISAFIPAAFGKSSPCESAKFEKKGSKKDIYHFQVSTRCTIQGTHFSSDGITDVIRDSIDGKNGFEIISSETIENEGHTGEHFILKEARETDFGKMNLDLEGSITANDTELTFQKHSTNIQASGNAKYTVAESSKITIQNLETSSLDVSILVNISIRKSKIAPKKIFYKQVKKGMVKELDKSSKKFHDLVKSSST